MAQEIKTLKTENLTIEHSTKAAGFFARSDAVGQVTWVDPSLTYIKVDGTNLSGKGQVIADTLNDGVNPDMGSLQNSPKSGITSDYIVDKRIAHSTIGSNDNTIQGGIRTYLGSLQVYLSGAWATVVTGFIFVESTTAGYALEHKPVGFTNYIIIMNGNSEVLGLNGLPITQGYKTSMGAYTPPQTIDGGVF